MTWVSFDPFRTLGFPDTLQLKPEQMFGHREAIRSANHVLFPEYWQVNALIFGLKRRIFPSYAAYQLGHDKIEMTRAFQAICPTHIPDTLIRANTPANADEIREQLVPPFVAKLPRSAEGRGVWLIRDRADWREYLARTDVLYVQEYLPVDRDARIVIVGNDVIAAYWRMQSADGFHNNVARGGFVDHSPVPDAAIELALTVAGELGIDYAGFDIVMVDGQPWLLEFNRLFGTQGIPGGNELLKRRTIDWLRSSPDDPDITPPIPQVA